MGPLVQIFQTLLICSAWASYSLPVQVTFLYKGRCRMSLCQKPPPLSNRVISVMPSPMLPQCTAAHTPAHLHSWMHTCSSQAGHHHHHQGWSLVEQSTSSNTSLLSTHSCRHTHTNVRVCHHHLLQQKVVHSQCKTDDFPISHYHKCTEELTYVSVEDHSFHPDWMENEFFFSCHESSTMNS